MRRIGVVDVFEPVQLRHGTGAGIRDVVGALALNTDQRQVQWIIVRRDIILRRTEGQVRDVVNQGEGNRAARVGCARISDRRNLRPSRGVSTQVGGIQHEIVANMGCPFARHFGRTNDGNCHAVLRRDTGNLDERADDHAIFNPRVTRRSIGIRRGGREIGIRQRI
jgi:hypothetical protein